jgi:hypothetical protein
MTTHPALRNYWYAAFYIGVFLIIGLFQAAALSPLSMLPVGWLIVDGLLFSLLLAALGIPLWVVVQFINFSKGNLYRQVTNALFLCVITLGCWLGLGLFVLYNIMPEKDFVHILPTIPMRVVGGLLFYSALVQRYSILLKAERQTQEIMEEVPPEPPLQIEEEHEPEHEQQQIEIIDRVAVKIGQKIHVIIVTDIIYIQAEGDYVMIHTADGRYLKEQTMKYFEQHLPVQKFVRIHRSCIVNVEIISRVELYEKQNYLLVLQNGEKLKTSASGYKLLKKALSL